MHNTNITNSDALPNKIEINVDVLGALVRDRVGRHVGCACYY